MAEKTEKATPKKLRDARKKGQVAKSQDFPGAVTFIVSMVCVLVLANHFFNHVGLFMLQMLKEVARGAHAFEDRAPIYLQMTTDAIIQTSAPIMIAVAAIGVLTNFLIIGPVFSMQAMKFDLKKLNPIDGIKQKFKLKVLVDLIKSCLKISAAAIIIYLIIKKSLPEIVSTVAFPPAIATKIISDFLIDVTIQVGVFFLLIALFDLFFQKAQFAKEMKMEKFEVKQEYKDTEGDPQIKGKRREMFREIAYQEGPSATKRARAVITNPTHFAVAIKYNPQEEKVPIILTMGAGEMASQIVKIAIDYKVPIMRNPDLARILYTKGRISHYVPEETYGALIEVLKWLRSLERNPDINRELLQ